MSVISVTVIVVAILFIRDEILSHRVRKEMKEAVLLAERRIEEEKMSEEYRLAPGASGKSSALPPPRLQSKDGVRRTSAGSREIKSRRESMLRNDSPKAMPMGGKKGGLSHRTGKGEI